MQWHQREIDEILRELKTSREGLSAAEAAQRLAQFGPNELKDEEKQSPFMMFLDQFKDFMILVLIGAAVISGFIGEMSDTVAILVIVVLNAVVGFVQEYRAERAMTALKKMAAPHAIVVRGGTPLHVPAAQLVPGDIITLEAGGVVPADVRFLEAVLVRTEEAALTGESLPVEKHTMRLPDEMLALGDRKNMAYKGTFVTHGRGVGVVVATGMATELGKIAAMLQEEKGVATPLQRRLASFGQRLSVAVLAICAIVFGAGMVRGEPALLMLLTAISLAVAAIPEALPAVVTVSLALGARKMVKQNALIRKLPAVETLGSVTYICTDKTGTLTMNKMAVQEIYVRGNIRKVQYRQDVMALSEKTTLYPVTVIDRTTESLFFTGLALSNDAHMDASGSAIGDPTEVALYDIAREEGYEKKTLGAKFPRVAEIPFDSGRKCMTTLHRLPEGTLLSFTKGAVDVLLEKVIDGAASGEPDAVDCDEILRINERMSADGLRVLAIAMRRWDELPADLSPEHVECGLTFLGLAGMMDPPREEAAEAVSMCMAAGIQPVMITGDHPLTAEAVARRLGILEDDSADYRGRGSMLTGRELSALSDEEIKERVEQIRVYARVAPEQKLKIVKALQDSGQFVAMTGDGVNDAPALKRADIGVAMGITGTDVSKESADMILLDDNFSTIVKAVKEGRKIYDNIRKFLRYLLTTNSGEIWTLFLAPLVGLPLPLLPIHILWINLMTDGLPALALAVEPPEGDVMKRPPRHPREGVFARGLWVQALWIGILMAGIALFVQAWSIRTGNAHWQTMVFTVLCLTQLGNAMAIRSERLSLFTLGLFSNKPLLGAVAISFVLQMAVIYVPVLNPIFRTAPLSPAELVLAIGASSLVFFAVELEKALKRSRKVNGPA